MLRRHHSAGGSGRVPGKRPPVLSGRGWCPENPPVHSLKRLGSYTTVANKGLTGTGGKGKRRRWWRVPPVVPSGASVLERIIVCPWLPGQRARARCAGCRGWWDFKRPLGDDPAAIEDHPAARRRRSASTSDAARSTSVVWWSVRRSAALSPLGSPPASSSRLSRSASPPRSPST